MNIQNVSNALKHVHNNLDVENQWMRAREGLAGMTALERAQVWTALSSHTLNLEQHRAAVVFSQYKALYKAALKNRSSETVACCNANEADDTMDLLKEYKQLLTQYYMFFQSFNIKSDVDGGGKIVVELKQVINSSDLLKDMKAEIKSVLETAVGNLAKSADLRQMNEGLKAEIKEILDTAVGNLAKSVDLRQMTEGLKAEIKAILDTALETLAKTADLGQVVEKEEQILAKLDGFIQTHEVNVGALKALIESLVQKTEIQIQEVNSKLDANTTGMATVTQHLDAQIATINAKLDEHASNIRTVYQELNAKILDLTKAFEISLKDIIKTMGELEAQPDEQPSTIDPSPSEPDQPGKANATNNTDISPYAQKVGPGGRGKMSEPVKNALRKGRKLIINPAGDPKKDEFEPPDHTFDAGPWDE